MRAVNLEKIRLNGNNIEANGCLTLTKANWPKISKINLGNYALTKGINNIGDEGCLQLSKMDWDLT